MREISRLQQSSSGFEQMSVDNVWYLDSSAIVKLVARESESASLRRFLRRRGELVSSALARTEVTRAVLELPDQFLRRANDVLARIDLVRINNRVLMDAGLLQPPSLRSLDAIHLSTAALFANTLSGFITYDTRMSRAASSYGWTVHTPD